MSTKPQEETPGVDWREFSKSGLLPQALYLFSCRLAWTRYGDERARQALLRATEMQNTSLRLLAVRLLEGCRSRPH